MKYGITGNPHKERLWDPVAELVNWLDQENRPFCLDTAVCDGLLKRELVSEPLANAHRVTAFAEHSDVILSFGGDGTFLRTAHELGLDGPPILGVNIGQLGFLADTEVGTLRDAIEALESGRYSVETRMALKIDPKGPDAETSTFLQDLPSRWAMNEFVFDRSGSSGLLRIEVRLDGRPLNTYWADGLIMATPTGSTAYSLSAGGPIVAPGTDAIVLTPIAPHTLTVRPLVLPGSATLEARVIEDSKQYILAADGRNVTLENNGLALQIQRAKKGVNLIKFERQDYFETLRSKLMWGA